MLRILQYEDGWWLIKWCDAVSAQHICKSDATDSSWPPQWEISVTGSQPWQVSVAEAGTRDNSVTALHGLNSTFFLLSQCVIFGAHLTPTVRVDFVVFFPAQLCFILKSLLMAWNRGVIPSFKENDNYAELTLPKQFKFWALAVAASFTLKFCGSFLNYSGSFCAFKARLRLKWFTRSEVFRPNTQIAVTWADKVADISILLSSVLLASSRLCINEQSQTAGRTLCEILTDTVPCALPDQTQMLYSPEYSLSLST